MLSAAPPAAGLLAFLPPACRAGQLVGKKGWFCWVWMLPTPRGAGCGMLPPNFRTGMCHVGWLRSLGSWEFWGSSRGTEGTPIPRHASVRPFRLGLLVLCLRAHAEQCLGLVHVLEGRYLMWWDLPQAPRALGTLSFGWLLPFYLQRGQGDKCLGCSLGSQWSHAAGECSASCEEPASRVASPPLAPTPKIHLESCVMMIIHSK